MHTGYKIRSAPNGRGIEVQFAKWPGEWFLLPDFCGTQSSLARAAKQLQHKVSLEKGAPVLLDGDPVEKLLDEHLVVALNRFYKVKTIGNLRRMPLAHDSSLPQPSWPIPQPK